MLITAAELATSPPGGVVVLDVRWKLGGPPGHDEYLTGHVPGAVYVDLDTELAAHGEPTDGRHPLPRSTALQASARAGACAHGRPVVVYDGEGNLAAARAWWLLRWAGLADVRLLDGALPAWVAAAGSRPTTWSPSPATSSSAAAAADARRRRGRRGSGGVLLDARAGERYRGETEPIDPRAGHIPGAVSAPTAGNLAADGTLPSRPSELRRPVRGARRRRHGAGRRTAARA